jgi:hypothetical protein
MDYFRKAPVQEDVWITHAKQIGIQAAAIIVAVATLFILYRLFTILHWIGDKMLYVVVPGLYSVLVQISALVVNLGRIATGITVLSAVAGAFWIYSRGPSLESFAQLELLYRFYKETLGRF